MRRRDQMSRAQRKEWANRVVAQLKAKVDIDHDHFVFLAGRKYRENLIPHIYIGYGGGE